MSEETPDPVNRHENLARDRTGMAADRTELALDRTTFAGLSDLSTRRTPRRGHAPVVNAWPLSLTLALRNTVFGPAGLRKLFAR
jgi:hypothetical protein